MSAKQRVGIVGYRGYSGAELVRILTRHPCAEPVLLEHREEHGSDRAIRKDRSPVRIPCTPEAVKSEKLALIFLATPPEVSMELAPAMLAAGARVIDLSGAFRLRTPENYTAWYKEPHTQPALLAEAAYGLPEFCRERIPQARLVSNPGCYPTAGRSRRRGPLGRHHLRRQIRCERGGTQAVAQNQLLRSHRELLCLFHLETSARAGGAPDFGLGGARIQLHRAAASAGSRHSRDHLLPGGGCRQRRGAAGHL